MDATQAHLLLNYFPLVGMTLGAALVLLGLWKRSERFDRLGLICFTITAVLVFPVYATGEIAGKGVDLLVGPVWTNIGGHRSSALPAFAAIEITGVLALTGLITLHRGSEIARWRVVALLVLSLTAAGLTARTTYLGRNIHTVDAAAAK